MDLAEETNNVEELGINDREYAEFLEKDVVVLLKNDGYLCGIFKSYDQYNNISLCYVAERIYHEIICTQKKTRFNGNMKRKCSIYWRGKACIKGIKKGCI